MTLASLMQSQIEAQSTFVGKEVKVLHVRLCHMDHASYPGTRAWLPCTSVSLPRIPGAPHASRLTLAIACARPVNVQQLHSSGGTKHRA